MSLEFAGEDPIPFEYDLRHGSLRKGKLEIRIFDLARRQPHGIKVGLARDYLAKYGGVHVYDAGFQLPFYGHAENDWLRIERDHAHRISRSELLPEPFQVAEGMTHLPTLSRVLGIVHVNTSAEPHLKISITRDRLVEGPAYDDLRRFARTVLDFYAMQQAKRVFAERKADNDAAAVVGRVERVEEVLAKHRSDIPEKVYDELVTELEHALSSAKDEAEMMASQVGLLGSLATAGISSLAFQHELKKQFGAAEDIVERLGSLEVEEPQLRKALGELRGDLGDWVQRARATNALFAYLADSENVQTKKRFRAKRVVDEVVQQMEFMSRGIRVETSKVTEDMRLPRASLVEWGAVFQNLLLNAFNAMAVSETKQVEISSRSRGRYREILVQDTGCGVDLSEAEVLFEPFVRRLKLTPERRALGYGGTGLGLTIVRLISRTLGCKVGFVEPDSPFETAFSISWREE